MFDSSPRDRWYLLLQGLWAISETGHFFYFKVYIESQRQIIPFTSRSTQNLRDRWTVLLQDYFFEMDQLLLWSSHIENCSLINNSFWLMSLIMCNRQQEVDMLLVGLMCTGYRAIPSCDWHCQGLALGMCSTRLRLRLNAIFGREVFSPGWICYIGKAEE